MLTDETVKPNFSSAVVTDIQSTGVWLSPLVAGSLFGLLAYGITLISPFCIFGNTVLFFYLFIWPLFLALLPAALLCGMAFSAWLKPQLCLAFVLTLLFVGSGF